MIYKIKLLLKEVIFANEAFFHYLNNKKERETLYGREPDFKKIGWQHEPSHSSAITITIRWRS